MKKNFLILSVFLLFFNLTCYGAEPEIIIIGNGGLNETSLTMNDLKEIYMGEKKFWKNGQKINVSMLISCDTQQKFHKLYLNMSLFQFVHHWKLIIFSGKGKFPKTLDTEQELINYVSETQGAIGYISSNTIIKAKNIKVFSVVG